MKNPSIPNRSKRPFKGNGLFSGKARRKWMLTLSGMFLAGLVFGLAAWVQAQSAGQGLPARSLRPGDETEPAMTPERELSRLAILEPAEFERVVAAVKTPQEIEAEQIAIFGITQPATYAAEFERFKDNSRRQKEQAARAAVLDPMSHFGSAEELNAVVRQKKARNEFIDEILAPRFISGNIAGQPGGNPLREIVRPASTDAP